MANPAFVSQGSAATKGANSTSTSIQTNNVQVGDLIFAVVSGYVLTASATATPNLPAGWTVATNGTDRQSNTTVGAAIFAYVANKIATSADVATSGAPVTYTFGINWSTTSGGVGIDVIAGAYRGGDQTTQLDDLQVTVVTSGTSVPSAAATASVANDTLGVAYIEAGNTGGIPSVTGTGLTSQIAYSDSSRGTGIQFADIPLNVSGTTAQYTATWQETINNNNGVFATAFTLLVKGASGTAYSQSIAGSLTPSGSISNSFTLSQTFSGTVSISGALSKKIATSISGSITAASNISKRTAKGISGAISGTGALSRKTSTSISASVQPTGALSLSTVLQKSVSGAITLASAIASVLIHGGGAAKRVISQIALHIGIRL